MNNAGRIGFVLKGTYDASVTYEMLDVVYYDGATYMCTTETTGNTPSTDSSYWQVGLAGDYVTTDTFSTLSDEVAEMQETFQDGVDTIYNAIVAEGVTPSSSTPDDCATAIAAITEQTWTETLRYHVDMTATSSTQIPISNLVSIVVDSLTALTCKVGIYVDSESTWTSLSEGMEISVSTDTTKIVFELVGVDDLTGGTLTATLTYQNKILR